jgi:hypothetical protein
VGGLTAWRYYKSGNTVAFGTAVFCAFLGLVVWQLFSSDLNGIYGGVLLLHGVIALLLLARPVHNLPAIWVKYLLAGTIMLKLISVGINFLFLKSEAFLEIFRIPYMGFAIYALGWIGALWGWLRSRHKSYLNLPLSQTYLWGNVLVFAISWFSFFVEGALRFLESGGRYGDSGFFQLGNLNNLLFHTLLEAVVASVVIWIWTQTIREPLGDDLPAEDTEMDLKA